jgi:hypothetical protein
MNGNCERQAQSGKDEMLRLWRIKTSRQTVTTPNENVPISSELVGENISSALNEINDSYQGFLTDFNDHNYGRALDYFSQALQRELVSPIPILSLERAHKLVKL